MTRQNPNCIRILIVEDETVKLGKIINVIEGLNRRHLMEIVEVRDAMSARRILEKERFDLLILDLKLPNRSGQDPETREGTDLLREITSRPKYIRPYHIIGITAFDDSYEESGAVFADHLWTLLKFDPTSDGWSRQLVNKIDYLLDSKELLRFSDGKTYELDLAILTALDTVEFDAIRRLSDSWVDCSVPHDSTRYLKADFHADGRQVSVVAAAAPRMGMAASAVLASKLIHNFRPRYLCMCGIAAGIKSKTNVGDVLAVDPSWDWGSGKRQILEDGSANFAPAPHQLPLAADIRDQLKAFADSTDVLASIQKAWPGTKLPHTLRLHVGPVASGAAVLADPKVVGQVKEQQRQLLGVEMEVYGMMTAAENCGKPRPTAFALKSVCDFGDQNKSDDHQAYAAYTSAQFLYRFVVDVLANADGWAY